MRTAAPRWRPSEETKIRNAQLRARRAYLRRQARKAYLKQYLAECKAAAAKQEG